MPGKLKKRIQNIQRKGHIYIFSHTNLQKQKKNKKKQKNFRNKLPNALHL